MASISRGPPLPGCGLPLGWEQHRDGTLEETDRKHWTLFRSALDPDIGYYGSSHDRRAFGLGILDIGEEYHKPDTWRMPPITLRETQMLAFMNKVTDKDGWETKVFDESVTEKWKVEVLEDDGLDFTREMAVYCIEELKYKAEFFKSSGCISLFHGDVVKSDNVVPSDLQDTLKAAVSPLEDVPEHRKDWHPGSDGRVLDIVHPSLYPLVYGLSRIVTDSVLDTKSGLKRCCEGKTLPTPEIEPSPERDPEGYDYPRKESYSDKFQWLPCDVDISGDTPRIVSYINNLHPSEHAHLYPVIEQIIGKIIPMWNLTLTPFRHFLFQRRIVPPAQISYGKLEDWKYVSKEGPQQGVAEDVNKYLSRLDDWKYDQKHKYLEIPNVVLFGRPQPVNEPVDLKKDYGDRGLQIIVKLANIHLTPEKPRYEGGSWHVEGQLNEHICASAIYYYDNENVTPSHLAFRQATDAMEAECMGYKQNDVDWVESIYGIRERQDRAVQNVGSLETREGRVISFPNILQHQVQPFELEDPTKPGHRKILALFLVDPNTRIISTANVPCQQREWWARSIMECRANRLAALPAELRERIIEEVEDFPISLDRAKSLRGELMEERKKFELFHDENFEGVVISLCEH